MCCVNIVDAHPVCIGYVKSEQHPKTETTSFSWKFTNVENQYANQNLTETCN